MFCYFGRWDEQQPCYSLLTTLVTQLKILGSTLGLKIGTFYRDYVKVCKVPRRTIRFVSTLRKICSWNACKKTQRKINSYSHVLAEKRALTWLGIAFIGQIKRKIFLTRFHTFSLKRMLPQSFDAIYGHLMVVVIVPLVHHRFKCHQLFLISR